MMAPTTSNPTSHTPLGSLASRLSLLLVLVCPLVGVGCTASPDGGSSVGGGSDSATMPLDDGSVGSDGEPSGGDAEPPPTTPPDSGPGDTPDAPESPECDYDDTAVCGGDPGLWCASGSCAPCDEGTFNCDGTRGCECADGCEGMECLPENDCTGEIADECGSDDRWCYTGHPSGTPQCRDCTDGFLNCDGLAGCEVTCEADAPCVCP